VLVGLSQKRFERGRGTMSLPNPPEQHRGDSVCDQHPDECRLIVATVRVKARESLPDFQGNVLFQIRNI
jgi:hypothetical protein